jgi:hypothetical protein
MPALPGHARHAIIPPHFDVAVNKAFCGSYRPDWPPEPRFLPPSRRLFTKAELTSGRLKGTIYAT